MVFIVNLQFHSGLVYYTLRYPLNVVHCDKRRKGVNESENIPFFCTILSPSFFFFFFIKNKVIILHFLWSRSSVFGVTVSYRFRR